MSAKGFRKDINGLRAWAVTAVVLFHFGIKGMSGGFVGVDVFFVISGFLMTQILTRTVESNGLGPRAVLNFYTARAIRIVPALVALVATLLFVGWFALPVADYRVLGKHAASSLTFISNIVYWNEANYFDASSHDKWLLHTWSLSVEWQFYLLLPLLVAGAWKLRPRRSFIVGCTWVGFIGSLALAIWLAPAKPSGAFFLLPTRAWEMFAGGLTFFYAGRLAPGNGKRVAHAGIALIAASIAACNAALVWPSYWALIPVGGAALVILSAHEDSPWTGSRCAQWIGDRSYSLYLWHWPLAVALFYFGRAGQPLSIALGLAMTLILAELSYRCIEKPSRRGLLSWKTTGAAALTTATALAVLAPALAIVQLNGIKGRLPASVENVFEAAYDRNPRWAECHVEGPQPIPGCKYGGTELGAIVIGDSHAAAVIRAVEKALPSKNLHVLDWTMSGCPTIEGVRMKPGQASPNCAEVVTRLIDQAAQLPKDVPVLIVNRSSNYLFPQKHGEPDTTGPIVYFKQPVTAPAPTPELLHDYQAGLIATACKFAETHAVYMLRPIPEMHQRVPNTMARGLLIGEKRLVSISAREYQGRHQAVWRAQDDAAKTCHITLLDPTPALCPNGECVGSLAGMPLYYDDNHLSEYGAGLLVPLFRSAFDNNARRLAHLSSMK